MAKYTYREETGYEQPLRSRTLHKAIDEAIELLRNGPWGQDADDFAGCTYEADILDSDGNAIKHVIVDILPDEPKCDDRRGHDWTSEGVWATGGTSLEFHAHCTRCGLRRVRTDTGAQRDPDQPRQTVRYSWPDRSLQDQE